MSSVIDVFAGATAVTARRMACARALARAAGVEEVSGIRIGFGAQAAETNPDSSGVEIEEEERGIFASCDKSCEVVGGASVRADAWVCIAVVLGRIVDVIFDG